MQRIQKKFLILFAGFEQYHGESCSSQMHFYKEIISYTYNHKKIHFFTRWYFLTTYVAQSNVSCAKGNIVQDTCMWHSCFENTQIYCNCYSWANLEDFTCILNKFIELCVMRQHCFITVLSVNVSDEKANICFYMLCCKHLNYALLTYSLF